MRSALASIYAVKIAAAYLLADKADVAAMVAALRSEERAAIEELRKTESVPRRRRRKRVVLAFRIAKAEVGHRKKHIRRYVPGRPRPWRRMVKAAARNG